MVGGSVVMEGYVAGGSSSAGTSAGHTSTTGSIPTSANTSTSTESIIQVSFLNVLKEERKKEKKLQHLRNDFILRSCYYLCRKRVSSHIDLIPVLHFEIGKDS